LIPSSQFRAGKLPERKFVLYFSAIGKRKFSAANPGICRTKKARRFRRAFENFKPVTMQVQDPAASFNPHPQVAPMISQRAG